MVVDLVLVWLWKYLHWASVVYFNQIMQKRPRKNEYVGMVTVEVGSQKGNP